MENEYLEINIEKTARLLSEKWFAEVYEEKLTPKELYDVELVDGEEMGRSGYTVDYIIKADYSILFFQKLEYYRELLTRYER